MSLICILNVFGYFCLISDLSIPKKYLPPGSLKGLEDLKNVSSVLYSCKMLCIFLLLPFILF